MDLCRFKKHLFFLKLHLKFGGIQLRLYKLQYESDCIVLNSIGTNLMQQILNWIAYNYIWIELVLLIKWLEMAFIEPIQCIGLKYHKCVFCNETFMTLSPTKRASLTMWIFLLHTACAIKIFTNIQKILELFSKLLEILHSIA